MKYLFIIFLTSAIVYSCTRIGTTRQPILIDLKQPNYTETKIDPDIKMEAYCGSTANERFDFTSKINKLLFPYFVGISCIDK